MKLGTLPNGTLFRFNNGKPSGIHRKEYRRGWSIVVQGMKRDRAGRLRSEGEEGRFSGEENEQVTIVSARR